MLGKEKKVFELTRKAPKVDSSYLDALDSEQIQPVLQIQGPVLVLAGAGSGKTRVLTYRVAHMINNGIKPEEILLLTFTNKAAQEMLKRVENILGEKPKGLTGGTYHHVGNIALRKYAKLVGLDNNYTIIDEDDAIALLKSAKGELDINVTEKRLPKEKLLKEILSLSINKQKEVEDIISRDYPQFYEVLSDIDDIFEKYKELKKKNNVVDYDDLLVLWHQLLLENEKVRNEYANNKYRYLLIDEYQDTNLLQSQIIKLLAGEEQNVMVVGDPNQSIYRWRGAEIDNILNFPKDFPNCKIYHISYNYRSTPEILNFANDSIQHNEKKSDVLLKTNNQSGTLPTVFNCRNVEDEASLVAQKILQLNDEGVDFSQIGILYRSHYMAKELEMELTTRNIPYDIRSGMRFFEQRHIKDVVSFIRLLENPKDTISWVRITQQLEGIGSKTANTIVEAVTSQDNPLEFLKEEKEFKFVRRGKKSWLQMVTLINSVSSLTSVDEIITRFMESHYKDYVKYNFENYKDRLRDIEALVEFSHKYNMVSSFLEEIALLDKIYGETNKGSDTEDNDKVTLSTIHKAKGLEWDYVFVIGNNEGQFPSSLSMLDPDEFEEERRLFYVASTRAKKELYLTFTSRIFSFEFGGYRFVQPSVFLQELNKNLYDYYIVE